MTKSELNQEIQDLEDKLEKFEKLFDKQLEPFELLLKENLLLRQNTNQQQNDQSEIQRQKTKE